MATTNKNIRFIKRQRLIEFLTRNPDKYTAWELTKIVHLCAETITKVAKEENLKLLQRNHGRPRKPRPEPIKGYLNPNYKFEDVI